MVWGQAEFWFQRNKVLEPAFKPQDTNHKWSGDLSDSDMKIVAGTTGVPEEPTGQEWGTKLMGIHAKLSLRGNLKKKNSIFVDIIQIKVDLPPSYPIFDKFIFDKVLIMLTSLPPLEFLTKIMKF